MVSVGLSLSGILWIFKLLTCSGSREEQVAGEGALRGALEGFIQIRISRSSYIEAIRIQ
jgi:hypothetical protein